MRRPLKILAISIGALVFLLVGGAALAYYLVDLDKVVGQLVAKHKPEIEKQLGRKVDIGKITTRLFPTLSARVEGLSVAPDPARPQDDRPLLKIEAVGFDVAIWKAIFSFGRKIGVKTVYVDGLQVNVLRYQDGRLSYQDILDRQAGFPKEEKPDEPLSPQVREILQGISIDQIRLDEGEIRLVDFATPTGQPVESNVRKLNLRLADVRLSDPIRLHADAAIFSDSTNFRFDATVGPLPPDLKVDGVPRIDLVHIEADNVDLARLAPYLGPALPVDIEQASFSANWKLKTTGADQPIDIDGKMALDKVQLRAGRPFDFRLDSKLTVDPAALSVRIDKLDLKVGEVAFAASGSLLDLAKAPRFEAFTLQSSTLAPGLLLAYFPPLRASFPKEARIAGAAVLDVKASGDAAKQTVTARLDLGPLDVRLPGVLAKPKGVPFGAQLDGDLTRNSATLRRLGLRLSELDLEMKGTVRNFSKPVLDLVVSAKPFRFDALARLLPSVGATLAASQATASGEGKLAAHVKGGAESLDAALDLSLLGVKLQVPGIRLLGGLRLQAKLKGDPGRDFATYVLFDADQATVQVKDVLDKTAATPMRFEISAVRRGDLVEVGKLDLRFSELRIDADGRFDLAKGTTSARVDMPRLDLEKLGRTVVAIEPAKMRKGFVEAKIALRGNPRKLETMELALAPFAAQYAGSDVQGEIRVENLQKPRMEMRLASGLLDVDALTGDSGTSAPKRSKAAQSAAAGRQPAKDDPSLRDYRIHAVLEAKKVVVSETTLEGFRGEVELVEGLLRLKDCTFRAFGGTITAGGTEAEIWKGRMPFRANLSVKGIDINKVLSAKTRYPNTLFGTGDLDVRLAGVGFETADLERHLLGQLDVALTEGRFARASLTESVAGGALTALRKIPGLPTKALAGDNSFRNLRTLFEVRDGRMSMRQPIDFALDGNRVQLGGAIGIAGGLFLTGTYFLPGRALEKMTGGKCGAMEELRVPVGIGGSIDAPRFAVDAKAVAQPLAERCLQAGLASSAAQALGAKAQALGVSATAAEIDAKAKQAAARAQAAKAEAEARAKAEAERTRAEVERVKAEAEQKARAEAERARAQAERAKAEAERKAREEAAKRGHEAKQKLGDKLKGLGF
ncbi:MAG: AsmA family protein [Deltaproteobacteria bacterium]|nr:AsmA family protein [Deltaproteobacteria bacterium]